MKFQLIGFILLISICLLPSSVSTAPQHSIPDDEMPEVDKSLVRRGAANILQRRVAANYYKIPRGIQKSVIGRPPTHVEQIPLQTSMPTESTPIMSPTPTMNDFAQIFNGTTNGTNPFEMMQYGMKIGQELGEMKKETELSKEIAELKIRLAILSKENDEMKEKLKWQ